MDIKAYCYIETLKGAMCFKCAVLAIITEKEDKVEYDSEYDLTLEMGDTGDGNDMRNTPYCAVCGTRIEDHYIA